MSKVKIELVNWVDSCSHHGWKDSDPDDYVAFCQSVGFVVRDAPDRVVLALNRSADEVTQPWGDLITIPKTSITKRTVLARVDRIAKKA